MLSWRFQKFVVKEFVRYIQRVLSYQTQWTNDGAEKIQSISGSTLPQVFESFPEHAERYPQIMVSAGGGQIVNSAFNDFILESSSTFPVGARAEESKIFSMSSPIATQLPSSLADLTISGVSSFLAWKKNEPEDVTVALYEDYLTSPVLKSSGSVGFFENPTYSWYFAEFYPEITLQKGKDYWIKYSTTGSVQYQAAIDPETSYLYRSSSTNYSGSVVSTVFLPPIHRFGGAAEFTIIIKCAAKNNTNSVYDLAELLTLYFELAKQVVFDRSAAFNNLSFAADSATEWQKRGISIKSLRMGALDRRPRGENDNIFSVSLSVDVRCEWSADFDMEFLKDITEEIAIF